MDLFPPQQPPHRARHIESAEDVAVFQDGTASLGGMGPALSDVAGAQRAGVHEIRDDLSATMDAAMTPKNHEIVIVEINEIAEDDEIAFSQRSGWRRALPWLVAGGVVTAVCAGWLGWQRLREAQ